MTTTRTYYGYTLWPIFEDEDLVKVIGWDVHHRDHHGIDSDPIAEMLPTLEDAKQFVREDRDWDRRMRMLGWQE